MEIKIDVYDIASKDEVKEAALDAIRYAVAEQFKGPEENLNRLIGNLCYKFVWEMVDKQFDGKMEEILRKKIPDIINDLSAFSVFREKDLWGKEESVAYKILQEEMKNARPAIKEKIENIIQEYPFRELDHDYIGEVIYECIMEKLFSK